MAQYEITPRPVVSASLNNVTDKRHVASLFWNQRFFAAPKNGSVRLNWR